MKSERHAAILDIIAKEQIETQEQLTEELRKRGISATQATVSRDIRQLRLTKAMNADGTSQYVTTDHADNVDKGLSARLVRIFSESVQSITHANNLIVVKTLSGSANAAGEMIDSLRWPEILGTIAGDNTLFLVIRSNEDVPHVLERMHNLI